jgi:hypothetical protein
MAVTAEDEGASMPRARGTGLLMVWTDIDPEHETGLRARDGNPWSKWVRAFMRHDVGSPGVCRRIFPK